jgi:recombinational DNA repair protein (RecF pathway)
MSTKTCRECGTTKDSAKGFYPNTGLICKACKIDTDTSRARDVKSMNTNILLEILEVQKHLSSEIADLRKEVNSMSKKLKKALAN